MSNQAPQGSRRFDVVPRIGRYIKSLALAVFVILLVSAVVFLVNWKPLSWSHIQQSTIQFLRRENLMFLVTDRVVSRVDVVSKEGNILLGWHESVLIGTVKFLCGIDLKKITPSDITREGDKVVISVPDPEVLELAVDLGSLVLFEKKSGLVAIKEHLESKDTRGLLQKELEDRARDFARQQELLPTRESLVGRLNDWVSPLLSSEIKLAVEFR